MQTQEKTYANTEDEAGSKILTTAIMDDEERIILVLRLTIAIPILCLLLSHLLTKMANHSDANLVPLNFTTGCQDGSVNLLRESGPH